MAISSLPYLSSAAALNTWEHNRARSAGVNWGQLGSKRRGDAPHFQQLLHVLAGAAAVVQPLAEGFIANVADEVVALQHNRNTTGT